MLGFINFDKKVGDTSCFLVNKVKKKLKVKCGHMGTLDPLASGVLPVGIGQATRLFDYLLNKEKTYIATFDFSHDTLTLDNEGEPLNFTKVLPTKQDILSVIPKFIGEIPQIPPVFSAKCVNGSRSYKLARQGVSVELEPKNVTINGIELLEQINESSFKFKIDCKGGTYIRSIARDIATSVNAFATMTSLDRIKSGFFTKENAISLEEFLDKENVDDLLIMPDKVLDFAPLKLSELEFKRVLDGLYDEFEVENGIYKVYNVQTFVGVGEVTNKILKMKTYVRDL